MASQGASGKGDSSAKKPIKSLTLDQLKSCVKDFLKNVANKPVKHLYGVTDGKAIGTHVEHAFHEYLSAKHSYQVGSSASGIDFPDLRVDLKVTSIKQPQSSCPFTDASQKVFGLGYHLIVMVYDKVDDQRAKAGVLIYRHGLFIPQKFTGDFQTTSGLIGLLARKANKEDVVAFLEERNLPLDEIGRDKLADRIMATHPTQGCLTVSNALQWRLQYGRAITSSLTDEGTVENLLA